MSTVQRPDLRVTERDTEEMMDKEAPEADRAASDANEELSQDGGIGLEAKAGEPEVGFPSSYSGEHVHPFVSNHLTDYIPLSQKQEEAWVAKWADVKHKWAIDANDTEYRMLWATSFLMMECNPWEIVGISWKFVYEPEDPTLDSKGHLWSKEFCARLAAIISHPLWANKLESGCARLQTALQYAIILRTNDQRPWHPRISDGRYMEALHELADAHQEIGPLPIRLIHFMAERISLETLDRPTDMSRLFDALNSIVKGSKQPLKATKTYPYIITLADLKNLELGLESISRSKCTYTAPEFLPPHLTAAYVSQPDVEMDAISFEQLAQWHDIVAKREFRWRKVLELRVEGEEVEGRIIDEE